MSFHVGQKVECIDISGLLRVDGYADVVKGVIYTVRYHGRSIMLPEGKVLLNEIVNPLHWSGEEPGWYAWRFRPITEHKTDISIFNGMLVPSSKTLEPTS